MIKRAICNLIYWAFKLGPNDYFVIDYGTEGIFLEAPLELPVIVEPTPLTAGDMQQFMEDKGTTFFCKARPGLPGEIEHIHQMPNTEGDKQRAKDFGFMVADECLIPDSPFIFFDGNGVIGRGD